MKKTLSMVFVIAGALFISSCNMNKDKKETDTTTTITDTSSSLMPGDNPVSTGVTTSSAAADTAATAKPNPDKKGKKGSAEVTITPKKTGSNADETDAEGYYTNVSPSYPGGDRAIGKFFSDNIQYPADAEDNGVEGTVTLGFTVDENGKVSAPSTIGPRLGYGLEEEAVRVFNKMPKWTPGNLKGKNVKTRFTLPVSFRLI
ncbi:MAG: TonB family protein [Ferruginibacter sp.]